MLVSLVAALGAALLVVSCVLLYVLVTGAGRSGGQPKPAAYHSPSRRTKTKQKRAGGYLNTTTNPLYANVLDASSDDEL